MICSWISNFSVLKKDPRKRIWCWLYKNSNLTTINTAVLTFRKSILTKDWKDLVQTHNLEDERG